MIRRILSLMFVAAVGTLTICCGKEDEGDKQLTIAEATAQLDGIADEMQRLLDNSMYGTEEGKYPESSKTILQIAIMEVTAARDAIAAGEIKPVQSVVSTATFTAEDAIARFKASVNGGGSGEPQPKLNYETFCFYYDWYGTPKFDGGYSHWAHSIEGGGSISGTNGDIGANFYPELGTYSSSDPDIIDQHMKMFVQARIGVLCLTYWNYKTATEKSRITAIMDAAYKYNIKVCFHIEPFSGRSPSTIRDCLTYIRTNFSSHKAYYTMNGKPVFFVYDSYLIKASDWATLLKENGSISIRGTANDAIMIALWLNDRETEASFITTGGFDGFYTYFGAIGFTYGSTPTNWVTMKKWADDNGKIFIPSVAPGYEDTRVRPSNGGNSRDRNNGQYYDNMYQKALDIKPKYISVTSFNEWHEGTQIEPAKPFTSGTNFVYLDYGTRAKDYYLTRTAYWIEKFEALK